MPAPLLDISDLRAGYTAPVVGPLSLSLTAGEIVGLVGPNGSGKSTALRAVVGAARVFTGHIRRSHARMAYQAQQSEAPEALPLRAVELLRLMDAREPPPPRLATLMDERLDRLSGGQRQLLAVWAVLTHPAPLVLLDEPTNNLDPDGVDLLAERLRTPEAGRGVLVVSHDRAFLSSVCTRTVEVSA